MPGEFRGGEVLPGRHVAEKPEGGVRRHLVVDAGDGLDLGVVGGDAASHQPVGRREAVEEVDADSGGRLLERLRGVEPRRAGTDDGDAKIGERSAHFPFPFTRPSSTTTLSIAASIRVPPMVW